VETELRPPSPSKKKQSDENHGLRTERQIVLYRQREAAKRERAERREVEARAREAEARVRHLNFELIQRIVLLITGVGIGIALIIGALRDPGLLKISLASASIWGAIAAALYRWERKKSSSD
jgi:Na+/H+ antiporter NhaD/arsenite permease-like protein